MLPLTSWEGITAIASVIGAVGGFVAAAATIVVAVLAYKGLGQLSIGAEQLTISKTDIGLRLEREAKSAAIVQCKQLAKEIIPPYSQLLDEFNALKIAPFVHLAAMDFDRRNKAGVDAATIWVSNVPNETQNRVIAVLNLLEAWSMYFVGGIADSEMAFKPASDIFCRMVLLFYPILLMLRVSQTPDLFSNIEQLFSDWQGKLDAPQIEQQEKRLEAQLETLRSLPRNKEHRKYVGADIKPKGYN